MMRRNAPSKDSETEKALLENPTLEDLLSKSDLSNSYKNGSPRLLGFLTTDDGKHIKELYKILMTSTDRNRHKTIVNLFQMNSNTSLLRGFVDSLDLLETAFKSLDDTETENDLYAAGTMSRFISRAFDSWPALAHQLFRFSNSLYKTIIENINKNCVFYTIQDLLQSDVYPLELFIWCLFRSLAGKEFIEGKSRPRVVYLIAEPNGIDYNLPDFTKTENFTVEQKADIKLKINSTLQVLCGYFRNKKGDPQFDDFRELLRNYLALIFDAKSATTGHIALAREIGDDQKLIDAVIDLVKTNLELKKPESSEIVRESIGYLTNFTQFIKKEQLYFIVTSLLDNKINQFTLLNLVELVRRVFAQDNLDWKNEAIEYFDKLLSYIWNLDTEEEKAHSNEQNLPDCECVVESECRLTKSIIFELYKSYHSPNYLTQSNKETQYADDNPSKSYEDISQSFMSSMGGGRRMDSEEDDTQYNEFVNTLQNIDQPFKNDLENWFKKDFIASYSHNDTENEEESNNTGNENESILNLSFEFDSAAYDVDQFNNYKWGEKFKPIQITPNQVEQATHEESSQGANSDNQVENQTNEIETNNEGDIPGPSNVDGSQDPQ